MAKTIEDITHSLDDILSLARVGRPSDPQEATNWPALVASIVEEYEDMGEPVVLEDLAMGATARATWLRRRAAQPDRRAALWPQRRSLGAARGGGERGWAVVRVDPGKGIPRTRSSTCSSPSPAANLPATPPQAAPGWG
jgi:hypothetical protein